MREYLYEGGRGVAADSHLLRGPLPEGFLPRLELLALQCVPAASVAKLHQLPGEVLTLEVEHVRVCDLTVEVLLVGGVRLHGISTLLHDAVCCWGGVRAMRGEVREGFLGGRVRRLSYRSTRCLEGVAGRSRG